MNGDGELYRGGSDGLKTSNWMEVLGRAGGRETGDGAIGEVGGPPVAEPYLPGCILQPAAGWLLPHFEQTWRRRQARQEQPAAELNFSQTTVSLFGAEADAGRVPSTVIPILPRFPGLDRAAIIAVFEHTFRPKKDLIKLRSPEFKASTLDNESVDLKSISTGLQFRKVVSVKDWGNDASLWTHCFHNCIAVWASFFVAQHPSCIIGMVLFHCRIGDLARTYKWQDCVLQLALDKH